METKLKDAIRATLYGALLAAAPITLGSTPAASVAPVAPAARSVATPAPAARAAPAAPHLAPLPAIAPVPARAPRAVIAGSSGGYDGSGYSETLQGGQMALDANDPAAAAWIFARVANGEGRDAEAAAYWQAFAESRAGRSTEALRSLDRFEKQYPQSRWREEAKALRAAVSTAAGKPVDPRSADDELKLYALDGLMQMEPVKAFPILKKFLAGTASPQLKERALFIATQTDLPEANALVLAAARDNASPDLQRRAIQIVAQTGEEDLLKGLKDVYRASTNSSVKQAVLEAYMVSGEEDLLLEVAKTDPDARSRGQAAELLGSMGATDALRTLYKQEKDPDVRQRLLNGLMIAGEGDALLDVARNDSNPRARRGALQALAAMDDDVPAEVFEDLYRDAKDPQDRDMIIDALQMRDAAPSLVKLFRTETDVARKRRMLQALSMMDSAEASKLLNEILEK